ncbi:hypothetical protein ACFFGV_15980 [Pontibacillus salicampi]|uniref:DUF2759 domain-containing protein n=1 Tax=Pontibacillus salicampi TaxID=1449801 RepID=A0ABV6LRP2_9BACI
MQLLIIHWYDWISPTNPVAAICMGVLFTIIACFMVWGETKNKQHVFYAFMTGVVVTFLGVSLLTALGFYA